MKKRFTKMMSVVLSLLMLCTVFPLTVSATTSKEHLSAVPEGYIGVYTIEDLYCIRNDLTANYILMNSIDLSEATAEGGDWSYGGRGWNPIGSDDNYSNLAFSGTFDGNRYAITGMNINIEEFSSDSYHKYFGLFSNITGTVKNLTVDGNISITHSSNDRFNIAVGGISASISKGTIENCINAVDININKSWTHNPNYSYTTVDMNVYIGGIVGKGDLFAISYIRNCINTGDINVTTNTSLFPHNVYCGGILGYSGEVKSDSSYTDYIEKCINTADINLNLQSSIITNYGYVSGICNSGNIENCYNNAKNLTATTKKGYAYSAGISYKAKEIDSCYNVGDISATSAAYAIGSSTSIPSRKSYFLKDTGINSVSDFTELNDAQMKLKSMYSNWDFDTIWTMEGREDYPYPELRGVNLYFSGENPTHKHNYISSVTKPATHLSTGIMTYTCNCGVSYTETIEKTTEHTYEAVVTEPTCTQKGYTTYTCECGDTYVADYVASTGHSYTGEITTPATHLADGVMTFTCGCGDSYTETIAKTTEHTYETVVTAPTCTEKGYTTYICECGDSYVADYVKENGHSYTSEITTLATHLTDGVMTFTCDCGDFYTEIIVKTTEHIYETVVTAPTCTENGYTTYTCECSDSYVSDYTDTVDHIDADGDYFCDYNCGYEFERPFAPENPDDSGNHGFELPDFEIQIPEIELPEISLDSENEPFSAFFAKLLIFLIKIGQLLSSISIIT